MTHDPGLREGTARSALALGIFRPGRAFRTLSPLGLIIGALFFAASLTPSLIPRGFVLQGVLGGVCLAAGYGMGVLAGALWRYMELPELRGRLRLRTTLVAAAASLLLIVAFLQRAPVWQDSIRQRMGMEPVSGAHSVEIAAIAALVFLLAFALARLFALIYRLVQRHVSRVVPLKVARVIGLGAAGLLLLLLVDGVLLRGFLRLADRSAAALDAVLEPDVPPPADPDTTGGVASLISWEALGRTGRQFMSTGPTEAEIAAFRGRPAAAPIRVYVGLNAAEDAEARADLALQEMLRRDAFDRQVLLVAVPTGTGWMDPQAMDPFEYLHDGDTAIVAIQYSYLSSWISVLAEPGIGIEAGRALFRKVYEHWITLPPETRPRFYLQGLSLGAYSAEQSVRLHEVLADPIQGALFSGPPYDSPVWQAATRNRNPGSPYWLPLYGDGSILRFTNQQNHLDIPGA